VAVVSMNINRVGARSIPRAMARMALDRRQLANTPGLMFWKLLGTGSGRSFSVRDADLRTWALFAVWEDVDAWSSFAKSSSYARLWLGLTEERWSALLEPVKWRGTWSGGSPFGSGGELLALHEHEPVAVLTRARVRLSQWRYFARSVPPVAVAVNRTPGLRYTVGIGEAPVGLQATFSIWDSESAMTAFAYRDEAHRNVMQRTVDTGWYAEELFARFRIVESTGTINGRRL
jgi:heme-degrading monooxygenase HmoA